VHAVERASLGLDVAGYDCSEIVCGASMCQPRALTACCVWQGSCLLGEGHLRRFWLQRSNTLVPTAILVCMRALGRWAGGAEGVVKSCTHKHDCFAAPHDKLDPHRRLAAGKALCMVKHTVLI
jgi:hypothetical protein